MFERNQHSCLNIVKFDKKIYFQLLCNWAFRAFLSLNPVITFKGLMIWMTVTPIVLKFISASALLEKTEGKQSANKFLLKLIC